MWIIKLNYILKLSRGIQSTITNNINSVIRKESKVYNVRVGCLLFEKMEWYFRPFDWHVSIMFNSYSSMQMFATSIQFLWDWFSHSIPIFYFSMFFQQFIVSLITIIPFFKLNRRTHLVFDKVRTLNIMGEKYCYIKICWVIIPFLAQIVTHNLHSLRKYFFL